MKRSFLILIGFLLFMNFLLADAEDQDSVLIEIPDIDIYDAQSGNFLDINPQYYLYHAYQNYNEDNFETAAKFYLQYLSYQNSDANSIYNLACCYGLLGIDSLTTLYLKRAYKAGFDDVRHIKGDPAVFDEAVTLTENYVNSVVTYLQNQYNISEIVLMGFSQGCWLTYYTGIRNPLLFNGLLCFGGDLPLDLLDDETFKNAKDLPIYIVHGENDRRIPIDAGINAASVLKEKGFDVEFYIFDGAHEVSKEGLEKGLIWLDFIK